ncbi:tubulin glycylase 3B [Drosophila santomea]|uniref:tubulin glycylase 3B n=1 Tax=Drosophila santomea TaxID=129105 RepID=UPI001954ACC6|nr:tubulin glycylase 3B [Drosophila santomea]XP_043862859.1 tubulin glycylase 3B [Drosophila santomea]XP_043862860.1 tubulin glycylase 3B [Drosophila santomea]XP_043862861.1 tubulin glycylase 3B [Drosophila santomea]
MTTQSTTPAGFAGTRNRYYNPVSKIQSLIHNLDAELVQLCKQCSVQKPLTSLNNNTSLGSHFSNYGALGGSTSMGGSSGSGRHYTPESIGNLLARARGATPLTRSTTSSPTAPEAQKRQMRNVYRTRVIDAYRNRRIFTVYGNYHTVRRALMRRGWLEKLPASRHAKLQSMSEDSLLEHARRGNDYEAVVISKMINHFPAFFIWQGKGQRDLCAEVRPFRNRVRRSQFLDFSTKVGLVGCAEQERWYREDGVCGMSYPRFYRLGGNNLEERMAFIEDYQQTQARSLLLYVREHQPAELISENGTIFSTTLDFALGKVKKMVRQAEHYSLDDARIKPPTPAEIVENQTFMVQSTDVLKSNAKFKVNEKVMTEYARLAGLYLDQIGSLRPDYRWDGSRNLWILKPGYQSRGIGIVIRSSLDDILQWTSNNQNKKYIVQKYIERPLLIYRTKFDIRQYMLLAITDTKVSIWTYRDCYLRFSSQEFTMDDLRESIHLTNNSVQKRYKNKSNRDSRLPKNNMWSLDQFKSYLRLMGAPDGSWAKTYNGFKQNLVAVVMASLDETELLQNAFELYGCDFMLDEHYNPILIEINSTPDLSPSTEITARICPMVLKDCIRVVVDLPKNPTAATGLFELAFEVNYSINKGADGKPLELNGKQMTLFENMPRMRNSPRTRLLRKILNNVKSSSTKKVEKAIEAPVKYVKTPTAKITKKKKLASVGSSSAASVQPSSQNLASKVILNPTARENLALLYTAPK